MCEALVAWGRRSCPPTCGPCVRLQHLVAAPWYRRVQLVRDLRTHRHTQQKCQYIARDNRITRETQRTSNNATYLIDSERRERRCVALLALQRCDLAEQALHQVTNGRTARNGVRVDNEVRRESLHCEACPPVGTSCRLCLSVRGARQTCRRFAACAQSAHAHAQSGVPRDWS